MHTSRFYLGDQPASAACWELAFAETNGVGWQGLLINERDDSMNSRRKQTEPNRLIFRWIFSNIDNLGCQRVASQLQESFSSFCTVPGLSVTGAILSLQASSVFIFRCFETPPVLYSVNAWTLLYAGDSSSWAVRRLLAVTKDFHPLCDSTRTLSQILLTRLRVTKTELEGNKRLQCVT